MLSSLCGIHADWTAGAGASLPALSVPQDAEKISDLKLCFIFRPFFVKTGSENSCCPHIYCIPAVKQVLSTYRCNLVSVLRTWYVRIWAVWAKMRQRQPGTTSLSLGSNKMSQRMPWLHPKLSRRFSVSGLSPLVNTSPAQCTWEAAFIA